MTLKRQLGLDILREKYSYASDSLMGFTSAQKIPDRWVATTCGYCSVGCGMLVGVKEGKAVSVRGNPDHPVNRGLLCPKGLSEHHTIEAETRAQFPLLRKNRKLVRIGWDERSSRNSALCRGNTAPNRWASSAPANWSLKSSTRSAS
jgi:anaerobic selenocysteine-containing dehydrogenase